MMQHHRYAGRVPALPYLETPVPGHHGYPGTDISNFPRTPELSTCEVNLTK